MAETTETVVVGTGNPVPTSPGTAGVNSQAPGNATTVSNVAGATGGIAPGNLVETDIDVENPGSDDPLDQVELTP